MAAGDLYATLSELKTRLKIDDAVDDSVGTAVLEAASRRIDQHCHRHFWSDTDTSTRYFTPEWGDVVFVDDIATSSGLVIKTDEDGDRTYERTWATSDYELEPANPVAGLTWPFTRIRVKPLGTLSFPVMRRSVEVTAKFGWPAVPDAINEACLLAAARLLERRHSPLGVAGNNELGVVRVSVSDPDVKMLLAPYVRDQIRAV